MQVKPVLFIIFNRPDNTKKVFAEICKQKPSKLFVFADGPRLNNTDDYIKCEQTRAIIKKQVDWDCDLQTMFLDINLGCGKGPAKAITWFFENVEEGIIMEDDVMPHPDFFSYCTILLEKYRNDEKIMVIGGATYHDDYPCEYSYTFSIYPILTAWATWRRVWLKYDYSMEFLNHEKLTLKLNEYFYSKLERKHWMAMYEWIIVDKLSSYWDWQFYLMMFYYEGIAIRPQKNMISNFGCGNDATHTNYLQNANFVANRELFPCLPLVHPPKIEINKKRDAIFFKKRYGLSLLGSLKYFLYKIWKGESLTKMIQVFRTNK